MKYRLRAVGGFLPVDPRSSSTLWYAPPAGSPIADRPFRLTVQSMGRAGMVWRWRVWRGRKLLIEGQFASAQWLGLWKRCRPVVLLDVEEVRP